MKKMGMALLGLLLMAGLVFLCLRFHTEAAAAWQDVRHLGALQWVVVLTLSLLNYGLRYLRWARVIQALSSRRLPSLRHLLIYVAGFAFTTTPGKAGEALRGLALKPFGVEYRHSFSAFIWERLMDMLVVSLLCCAVVTAFPGQAWLLALAGSATIAFVLVLRSPLSDAVLAHFARRCTPQSRWRRLSDQLTQTRHDTLVLLQWGPLGTSLALGFFAWLAEGVGLFYVVDALGTSISPTAAVGVYALSMLVGALSFIPGGLGSAEAVMVLGLTTVGCSLPTAAAATVICRMATLWFAIVLGLLACLALGHDARRPGLPRESAP